MKALALFVVCALPALAQVVPEREVEIIQSLYEAGKYVDAARRGGVSPTDPVQLVPAPHSARSREEQGEQLDLAWREVHRLALARDDVTKEVDVERPGRQWPGK